jgi:hypothetical protein
MGSAVQLKLDPWTGDVEGAALLVADDAIPTAPIDVKVESPSWRAIAPGDRDATRAPCVFIDGVRRVDARLLAGGDFGQAFGLLGSLAVGAVRAGDGPPTILAIETVRLLILGHGSEHPGLTVDLPRGHGPLSYSTQSVPGDEPEAPLLGLQTAMRRAETALARCLAGAGDPAATAALPPETLIVADGPLAYLERTPAPLVGLIKSLHRAYLGAPERDLLPLLRPGERTPIFSIRDKNQRYSWYLRLGNAGPAEHELAGIVRLECASQSGIAAAKAIANRTAALLMRFASTRARDPRSPQNLVPIGGLEAMLRHRLGDRALVRRAILAALTREAALLRQAPLSREVASSAIPSVPPAQAVGGGATVLLGESAP